MKSEYLGLKALTAIAEGEPDEALRFVRVRADYRMARITIQFSACFRDSSSDERG